MDNMTPISKAQLTLEDNYIKVYSDGDVAGIQLLCRNNALIESQLDYDWSVVAGSNKVLIYTTKKLALPNIIARYYGDMVILNCKVVDYFNNSVDAYIRTCQPQSQIIDKMTTLVNEESNSFVQDMDNFGANKFIYKKGIRAVPKQTFKNFLTSKNIEALDVSTDDYKTARKIKSRKISKDTKQKTKTKRKKGGK